MPDMLSRLSLKLRRPSADFEFTEDVPLPPSSRRRFSRLPDIQDDEDYVPKSSPVYLHRNRSERFRIQPLYSTEDSSSLTIAKDKQDVPKQSWKSYFVNIDGRKQFFAFWVFLHALLFAFSFVNYQLKDNLTQARGTFGMGYVIARSAAFVLNFDVAFILLPVCRNLISAVRRTPLNSVVPFDDNHTFHKSVGWSLVFFSLLHIGAHMYNAVIYGKLFGDTVKGFFVFNFARGPGLTGWIMTLCLCLMVFFAIEKRRKKNYERFWYSHHLFIPFFICWQLHGMFCMIKPDRPPYCSWSSTAVFWKYWLVGGVIYIGERILREVRARHTTYISKVIQHPSRVVEIQIKKEKISSRAGQFIFLNCPEISYWQWHPFTLTSAPEEDFISIHVRIVGDFTEALANALGCDHSDLKDSNSSNSSIRQNNEKTLQGEAESVKAMNRVLPRIMVDGPFGSASEDFYKYEVAMLVGAGIGVTPFASILKSIWYRINYPNESKPTQLSKVYFFWICRDFESSEWFRSLLHALEEQDLEHYIEVMVFVTAPVNEDDVNNIILQDVGGARDAITQLRAPTHYGRPNWNNIFKRIAEKHPDTDIGTFFCGPQGLGSTLHDMCKKYSGSGNNATRFFWNKENF